MKKVLEKLSKEFEKKKVPAQLTEDGKALSLYLSKDVAGREVYTDIWFRPYAEDKKEGGYWILRSEVAEVSGLSPEEKSELANRIAVINPGLLAGGYGLFMEDEVEEEYLTYRISVPLNGKATEEFMIDELLNAASVSAEIIKDSAGIVLEEKK